MRFIRPLARERRLFFWLPLLVYLVAAFGLVIGAHNIVGDAWSRVGNAFYVLYSRDPHLAAIGFVWNPLPSVLMMPLLPLRSFFPPLVEMGFAANIVSAACMAAAVWQLHGTVADLGLRRPLRVAFTTLFAAHPMVILYAANGMSEAPFLLFLIIAIRQLARWLRSPNIVPLVFAGLALALAYFTRYEAVAAAVAAALVVAAVGYTRAPGDRSTRTVTALADALVIGVPFAAAFLLWALVSWIIVGSPFETFTSIYGNSSQVGLAIEGIQAATGQGTPAALGYALSQVDGLEPLLLVGVMLAGGLAIWRRDLRLIAPTAILGAVMLFALWAFMSGKSFGWLRFWIDAIPLMILACASLAANGLTLRPWAGRLAMAVAVASCAVALPVAALTMLTPNLAREEAYQIHDLLPTARLSGAVAQANRPFVIGGEVARYIDSLALARGAVLIDVATGFPIVLQSKDTLQFVITPDRDFPAVLSDPAAFGVRYVIVQSGEGTSQLDAVGRTYNSAQRASGQLGALARHFGAPEDNFGWDVYVLPAAVTATNP
jgi:hypothetical protein